MLSLSKRVSKREGMADVGSLDRSLRLVLGAVVVASAFTPPLAGVLAGWGASQFAVAAMGIGVLGAALFGDGPACANLGIQTCRVGKP